MARNANIQVRRDTAANWTSVNPVLNAGEIGFETNTGKVKIGDGTTAWTSLTYVTDGSKLTGTIAASTATTLATARNINGVSFNGSADITVTATPTDGTVTDAKIATTLSPSKVTGTAVTQADTGTVTSTMILDGTILNADINTSAAIAASKISGTAYTYTNKKADEFRLANTLDVAPRTLVNSSRSMVNGNVYYTLFTPSENVTISNIVVYCTSAGTDTGGTSVRRMGLFTCSGTDNTTLTLVARTASDATIGNTLATAYTRALDATGGYVSSYSLVAGTTYAFGMICYNTGGTFGTPSFAAISDQFPQLTPYRILTRSAQTDLVSTTGQSTGGASAPFARLT